MATNNIQENLKKYFYSGVGLAAHTAEVVQKSMHELIRKGKVSESDGKKIVNEAIKKIEARRPEIEAKYNAAVHKFVKTTTSEMNKLQKRIQKLEGQLKTKPSSPVAATKSSTKTKTRATRKAAPKTTPVKETQNTGAIPPVE